MRLSKSDYLIERNGWTSLKELGHCPEHSNRRRQFRQRQWRRRRRWRHPASRLIDRFVAVEEGEHGGERRAAEWHPVDVVRGDVVAVDDDDAMVRVAVLAAENELLQIRLHLFDALGLEELERVDELEQHEADLLLPRLRVQLGRRRQLRAERRQRLDLSPLEHGDENWKKDDTIL